MSAQGWDLEKGDVSFRDLSEADVVRIVNAALSPAKRHTTSYKYAFFKSLLDNIFNVDLHDFSLTYDSLALRFAEIYWNLSLYHHLRQMPQTARAKITSVEKIIRKFCDKNGFDYSQKNHIFLFESLRSDLQLELARSVKSEMLKYVVGAFYRDTEGQLYSFDKKDEGIKINPSAYEACVKFKSDFEKINYFEWIRYLEKVNAEEDAYALANKLDASTERKDLSPYRKVLQEFDAPRCFYCGRELPREKHDGIAFPVDHVIPWSFVKDDKLWNFVLACTECNSAKSDVLPAEGFVASVKKRNERLSRFDSKIVATDFRFYTHERLDAMFKSAEFNGFLSGWKPKNRSYKIDLSYGEMQAASPE